MSARVQMEVWTPEDARRARSLAPAGQRAVDQHIVKVYRVLWEEGRWFPQIGAPMCWMEDGSFGNGNHRAEFIASLPEGTEVPVLVSYDVPVNALRYMDGGKNRTLGHHLRYAFPEKADSLCANAASIATIAMTYYGPGALPRVDVKPDPHTAVSWAVGHGDRLFKAAEEARRIAGAEGKFDQPFLTVRTLGFVLYALGNNEEAVRFFDEMAHRSGYSGTDPRSAIRTHYARKENVLPRGAQGREITLRRIAEMLGVWDAYQRKVKWQPWDISEKKFRHPIVDHAKVAA